MRCIRRTKSFSPVNVCVTHDRAHGQLLMGHHCNNFELTESTCIATSADTDGEDWVPAGSSPRSALVLRNATCADISACCATPCEMHADSSNCVRFDQVQEQYVLTKRQAFATSTLPRAWREIRGVLFATANHESFVNGRCYAQPDLRPVFTTQSSWYLDREGKEERFRRQIYSLSLGELLQRRLYVGVMAILNWPSVNSTLPAKSNLPPYFHDTMSAYLLPSRDGVTFDLSSIYANQPTIPHGECKPGARDARISCAYDHAYIQPASELLTYAGQHWLYYEGRPLPHKRRWKAPAKIAIARWPLHRLSAVRADPRCAATNQSCGQIITRSFELKKAHALTLNVRAGTGAGSLHVEVLRSLRTPQGLYEPLEGFAYPDAQPILEDSSNVHATWRTARLGQLNGTRVRLRFSLCGDAALFAWTLW